MVRKKFVRLLPEEWVRQHLVHFLQIQTKWPLTHIAVELGLKLPTGLQKRCDVLLHGPNGQPVVLAECKAPNIALTQQAVNQVAQYNLHFKLPYLVVTNGLAILIYHINFETKQIESQAALPNLYFLYFCKCSKQLLNFEACFKTAPTFFCFFF